MKRKTPKKKKEPTILDYEYGDALIPVDYQLGLKWIGDKGERYTTGLSKGDYLNGKRIARLIESSYVGTTAIGAMHYYGRIEVSQPSGLVEGQPGCRGGYMGKQAPKLERISLQVKRRITKHEEDLSGESIGKIGEYTYRFNTEAEVRPHAIKLFKRKFSPGWVLLEQYDGKVLCET